MSHRKQEGRARKIGWCWRTLRFIDTHPSLLQGQRREKDRTSLVVQWLGLRLPVQGLWVRSLGQGTNIPHASWPKNQNRNNRSTSVINYIKTLKMVQIKKNFNKIKCMVDNEMHETGAHYTE